MSQPQSTSRLPFWANLQLLVLTFILIGVGGSVTSTKSGMAVPDWPGTGGEFLLFAPFKFWVHDVGRILEHSHRLVGTAVGLAAIAVAVVNWLHAGQRKWLKWHGLLLLACVVLQGLLGGFRVSENNQFLAAFHGVFGQLTFGLMVLGTLAWSKAWAQETEGAPAPLWQKILVCAPLPILGLSLLAAWLRQAPEHESTMQWRLDRFLPGFIAAAALVVVMVWMVVKHAKASWPTAWKDKSRSTRSHAWMVLGLLVVQLCLGAAVRHLPAAHAIPTLTMAPPMSQKKIDAKVDELTKAAETDPESKRQLDAIMLDARRDETTGHVYLPAGKVHLHLTHRVVGFLIGLICIGWLAVLKKRKSLVPVPLAPKLALGAAVALQIALGMFTVLSGVHAVYATSHQTMGALLIAAAVWLAVWTCLASKEKA